MISKELKRVLINYGFVPRTGTLVDCVNRADLKTMHRSKVLQLGIALGRLLEIESSTGDTGISEDEIVSTMVGIENTLNQS